ncbi:lytic transglycosylase domain-containing protein [Brevundimonas sp. NPDC046655]|uniref:lytic transglycosylase domain-containing protein n=1 Tax=unclassified Brevundimonas TaxID=2622653 RepID=UPI00384F6979
MLDLAIILSLAQTCAPTTAPETLAAIAYVESRFDPLAIGVNRGPRPSRRPRDRPDAVRIARGLLARGADLDLGVGQINSGNLAWLGLSVEDVFDPCRNLAASAKVLRTGYRPSGHRPDQRQAALRAALSRYNTGHPERGFRNGYVGRVEAAAVRLSLTLPAPDATVRTQPVPITAEGPPPPWDIFARARGARVATFKAPPFRSSLS